MNAQTRIYNRITGIFETAVMIMIGLVLIQTFLEDFTILMGAPWPIRRVLIYTGFGFDLFFTLEFFIRFFSALEAHKTRDYFYRKRGWIDFTASVPLLTLQSGPGVLALIFGTTLGGSVGGVLTVLKVIKAIRIARVLRLLRVLKVFRRIKNADSIMAQHHVSRVATLAVSCLVFFLLGYSFFMDLTGAETAESLAQDRFQATAVTLGLMLDQETPAPGQLARRFAQAEPDLLMVRRGEDRLYSRYDRSYYDLQFGPSDYQWVENRGWEFFFDLRPVHRTQARDSLFIFGAVVVIMLIVTLVYSPHFAMTISDPVHVMLRGMTEPWYNLQVDVLKEFEEDDLFQLSKAYNEIFLPLKARTSPAGDGPGGESPMDLSDVTSFLEKMNDPRS